MKARVLLAFVWVNVAGRSAPGDLEPVLVVLFPADPKKRRRGYLRAATTAAIRPRRKQTVAPLQLIRIVPGRYLVAAIPKAG